MPVSNIPKTCAEVLNRYAETRRNSKGLEFHTRPLIAMLGDTTLEDICKPGAARDFCHKYSAANSRLSKHTVRKRLSIFQSSLRWAWQQEWIPGLPMMWLPKPDPTKDRALSSEDIAALYKTADTFPTEPHLRVYIYLALQTGQHMGEILNMTWDQVKFSDNTIVITKKGEPKKMTMSPKLRAVLELAHGGARTKYIVEFRAKKVNNVFHGLRRVLKRAGVGNISAVDLRLNAATVQEQQPIDPDQARLFVSYCSEDGEDYANTLVSKLEADGQDLCWIAPRDTEAGMFPGQLTRAIKGCRALVVIVTPAANESADVLQEVLKAHNAKKTIVPIIVKNTTPGEDLEYYLNVRQQISWNTAEKVARAIVEKLEKAKKAA